MFLLNLYTKSLKRTVGNRTPFKIPTQSAPHRALHVANLDGETQDQGEAPVGPTSWVYFFGEKTTLTCYETIHKLVPCANPENRDDKKSFSCHGCFFVSATQWEFHPLSDSRVCRRQYSSCSRRQRYSLQRLESTETGVLWQTKASPKCRS